MVKPWVKIFGIALVVAAVAFGLVQLGGGKVSLTSEGNEGEKESKNPLSGIFSGKSKDYMTLGIDTYSGHAGLIQLNNGLEPNENCELYKKFGIKLKILVVENDRSGFKSGDIDVAKLETNALAGDGNAALLSPKL